MRKMKQEALEKYNKERKNLLRYHRKKKLLHSLIIIGSGLLAILIIQLLGGFQFKNAPATIAFSAVVGLFTIIWFWVKMVMLNHRMQKELLLLEDRASDKYYHL